MEKVGVFTINTTTETLRHERLQQSLEMGNCSLKGMAVECEKPIRILTDSGNIINFHGAKQVDQILKDYPPGYGVFRQRNLSLPLPNSEPLNAGKSYFLLPLSRATQSPPGSLGIAEKVQKDNGKPPMEEGGEGRGKEPPSKRSDAVENLGGGSGLEVLPAGGDGVWRVKLVIDTKQLEEILAEEVNTEALIERMRAAAAAVAMAQSPRRAKIRGWKPALGNWLKLLPIDMGNNKLAQIKDFNSGNACLYAT